MTQFPGYAVSPHMSAARGQIASLHFMRALCLLLVMWDHLGLPFVPMIDHLEVPGFYIMSGMLFKARDSWTEFGRHISKRLIWPYFKYAIFFVVILLIEIWIDLSRVHIGIPEEIKHTTLAYWLVQPANYPLWMLKALVWAYILYRPLSRLFSVKNGLWWAFVAFVLASVIGAMIGANSSRIPMALVYSGLPQGLQALPLMVAGGILMKCRYSFIDKIDWRWLLPLGLGLVSLAAILCIGFISMYKCDLGTTESFPVLFYLRTVVVFSGFLCLAEMLPRITPMEFLSRKSIEVLGLHAMAIELGFFIFAS